jgi:hypothetical protein
MQATTSSQVNFFDRGSCHFLHGRSIQATTSSQVNFFDREQLPLLARQIDTGYH